MIENRSTGRKSEKMRLMNTQKRKTRGKTLFCWVVYRDLISRELTARLTFFAVLFAIKISELSNSR